MYQPATSVKSSTGSKGGKIRRARRSQNPASVKVPRSMSFTISVVIRNPEIT